MNRSQIRNQMIQESIEAEEWLKKHLQEIPEILREERNPAHNDKILSIDGLTLAMEEMGIKMQEELRQEERDAERIQELEFFLEIQNSFVREAGKRIFEGILREYDTQTNPKLDQATRNLFRRLRKEWKTTAKKKGFSCEVKAIRKSFEPTPWMINIGGKDSWDNEWKALKRNCEGAEGEYKNPCYVIRKESSDIVTKCTFSTIYKTSGGEFKPGKTMGRCFIPVEKNPYRRKRNTQETRMENPWNQEDVLLFVSGGKDIE